MILEVLQPEDASIVLDYYIRNRSFLEPWESRRDYPFYSLEYQKILLELEYKKIMDSKSLRYWLFKKEDYKKKVIGNFGLSNIIRGTFQSCYLGYKLDKEEEGHGYMSEALKACIHIAFHDMGLHRMEANIMPHNKRSSHVVERLGFSFEGMSSRFLNINGIWEDHLRYALINENF
ncbi:GNAT family N-acetyltransferase [Vallitalea okinawensis]|uniref:GNAT family N-acetyltransferase n=1 Tax=Vallitalea okinawensis TaxID=2078660 RepID=UPI001FA8B319|nr:GNAT family N-acetyltransferase [Vallitalea okinawensis]